MPKITNTTQKVSSNYGSSYKPFKKLKLNIMSDKDRNKIKKDNEK